MTAEQTPHEFNPVDEEPDDAVRTTHVLSRQHTAETRPTTLSWREHQALGDEAYDLARERQKVHDLDDETVSLYEQASSHLLSAIFMKPERMAIDPISDLNRNLRIASSLGWQAQAMEPGVMYEDHGSNHIDKKTNLQEIAYKTQRSATVALLGKTGSRIVAEAGELADMSPSEVVAEAAVEAAKEAGTDEHIVVRGIGKVDAETSHLLETEGNEAILRFMGEHAMDPRNGGEFTALMAEEIVEEVTREHELAQAA